MLTQNRGKWISVCLLGEESHNSFEEAFTRIYLEVQKLLEKDSLQYIHFETMWVESPQGKLLNFYDARDLACDTGLLVNGQLREMK